MSQSTPTPSTTARTETAETVTVPRAAVLRALNFIENTESEMGEPLGCGVALRDALDAAPALASPQHPVGVREADFLQRLRAANVRRDAEYRAKTSGEPLPILFRTTEFAGEVGELLNVVKKMERERLGWSGKRATREMLLEEFGGVVATLDLLAMALGVDLAEATAAEFNAVTDRLSLSTRLSALSPQHPVGVREALFDHHPDFLGDPEAGKEPSIREMITAYYREHLEEGDAKFYADRYVATLSHPPAQDAPGAVKAPEPIMWICEFFSEEGSLLERRITEDRERLPKFVPTGNTLKITPLFAALAPSPPLPEADGEVVTLADRIDNAVQAMSETHRSWEARCHAIMAALGFNFGWDDAEQDAALVSALRERDEARELAETYREARERYREERDAERAAKLEERAAREKAEQAADRLREAVQLLLPVLRQSRGEKLLADMAGAAIHAAEDALRASTEEGKTATPSVKEEEAGRG